MTKKKQQYPNITIEPLSNDQLWDIARNLTIEQRTELFGAPTFVRNLPNRQVWLDTAMQRSKGRCIARWQSIGMGRNEATALADDVSIGIPPSNLYFSPGQLIILTGEMGIGKSLIGDRFFQFAIRCLQENPSAPIPLFFEAWQLQKKSLEEVIKEGFDGLCNPQYDKVIIIIDGIDGIGITNSSRLIDEARILVNVWQQSFVLLISKPTLELNSFENFIKVSLLSEGESENLVRRLTSLSQFSISSLPKILKDAIRRPLFAVLLSTYIRDHGVWRLQLKEQLLANLVERSLRPLRENVVRISHLLEQLAAICIGQGGMSVSCSEIASWTERQQLLDSRLVVEDGDRLQFPIPILTQWFGAQYLLNNQLDPNIFRSNKYKLELWQAPLAIAVATFPLQRVSELLVPIVEKEPLIAADIVSEALAFQGLSMKMPSQTALELAQQVRIALQAWINGFKILATSVGSHLDNNELPTIGVRISRQPLRTASKISNPITTAWIEVAWHSGGANLPDAVELPSNVNSESLSSLGWKSICGFPPYLLTSWIWKWTLEQMINLLLKPRSIPVKASLLSLEAAWHGASRIIERDYRDPSSISLNEIKIHLSEVEEIQCSPMIHHCLEQLWIEMKSANLRGSHYLCLPDSFQSFRSNHTHSYEALLAYAKDVYLGAFEGYLRLIESLYPFIPNLKFASILPAKLVGILTLPNNSDEIFITHYWEPLPAGSQNQIVFSLSEQRYSWNNSNMQATIKKWKELRPQWWMNFTVTSKSSQLTKFWLGANPVTELAYKFLWEDFKRMGWVNDDLNSSGFPYTY